MKLVNISTLRRHLLALSDKYLKTNNFAGVLFVDDCVGVIDKMPEISNKSQEWISVKDRLPMPETNVLIMQHFAETAPYVNVTIGHLHQDSDLRRKPYWYWISYGADMVHPKIESFHRAEFICPGNEYVTHWMPLPEPPKEDK